MVLASVEANSWGRGTWNGQGIRQDFAATEMHQRRKESFTGEDRSSLMLYETEEQKGKTKMKYLAWIALKSLFHTLISLDIWSYLEKQQQENY